MNFFIHLLPVHLNPLFSGIGTRSSWWCSSTTPSRSSTTCLSGGGTSARTPPSSSGVCCHNGHNGHGDNMFFFQQRPEAAVSNRPLPNCVLLAQEPPGNPVSPSKSIHLDLDHDLDHHYDYDHDHDHDPKVLMPDTAGLSFTTSFTSLIRVHELSEGFPLVGSYSLPEGMKVRLKLSMKV